MRAILTRFTTQKTAMEADRDNKVHHLRSCREKLQSDRTKFDDEYHVRVSNTQTEVANKKEVINKEHE